MSDSPLTPEILAALARPAAHGGDPSAASGVEWLQTHLSHVFLTRERVVKFRKPVDLGFVCFTSLAERNADCLREVALNRRLAPDVYLGVAPLLLAGPGPRVGPIAESLAPGEPVPEHCVVMRRLPAGRDALSLLRGGALSEQQLDAVAVRIARFHDAHALGAPAPFTPDAWRERCVRPVEDNFRLLGEADEAAVPAAVRARAETAAREFATRHAERFEARRRAGRAVDGHGDLHLDHVWFESAAGAPLVIDCLEFSERLRRIDAAAEVAFLAMDLRYRGAPRLAERFLRSYARERDDYDLYCVVDYFVAYRAAVRAKVAAVAVADSGIAREQRERAAESARAHLELAARSLDPRPRGLLVLVGGVAGSGKTTVAEELAREIDGVAIASDRLRKQLAGLSPTARASDGWRSGLYAPEVSERVYAGLRERARPVLVSGRPAILDATFSLRREREAVRALAAEVGCEVQLVEVRCAREVALRRLERRERAGDDASDAGPALYDRIAGAFEPPEEWPAERRTQIASDAPDWRQRARALGRRLCPQAAERD